jgi:hypothetical protein
MIKEWIRIHFADISYQLCHFLLAYSTMLTATHYHGSNWLTAVEVTAFAAVKEFYYDPKYEGASLAESGLLDFSFYELGIAVAWLVLR